MKWITVARTGCAGGALLLTLAVPASAQQRVRSALDQSVASALSAPVAPVAPVAPIAPIAPVAPVAPVAPSISTTLSASVVATAADTDGAPLLALADTVRRRPVAIEYSDWYGRRLKIHQVASWTMLPLFAVQYAAGQQLIDKGRFGAPSWARNAHAPLATTIGVLFGVNTLTGAWNLWDARKDPAARKWRTAHAVLMLVADAGFAITPAFVDDDGSTAGSYESKLRTHRNFAIASMSVATVSWLMMLPPFRHE